MKLERKYVERIDVMIRHYNSRINELSQDASKVAEVRAVRTLRDGALQALQLIELDGLNDSPDHPYVDLDQASIPADEFGNPKFVLQKFSSERIAGRESQPLGIRFSEKERSALQGYADRKEVKISDIIRSALIFSGVFGADAVQ